MLILSHRGYWRAPAEKNTAAAFAHSFALGFGTETDVRDSQGELVISHDMPRGAEMTLSHFLQLLGESNLPLALNIKADGLAALLAQTMQQTKTDWFVFDMAVPDMRAHFAAGNPVFTRMSEVEQEPAWLELAAGVWLDGFESDWHDNLQIEKLLAMGKRVCIVSPELHGRPHQDVWQRLRHICDQPDLLLCTDLPETARAFFGEG